MGAFSVFFFMLFVAAIIVAAAYVIFYQYRKFIRQSKNYERGLKMATLRIHLPPTSTDIEAGGRDQRDVTEEVLSQAQVMYNVIASIALKGLRSKIYGQRHLSFEIVSNKGLVCYYVAVPVFLVDVIKQAVISAYPSARLEEERAGNIFSQRGQMSGTIGGEFSLKKDFIYPIHTYQDSKQDASRSLLNALSSIKDGDGAAVQILIRPADEGWTKRSVSQVEYIRKSKLGAPGFSGPDVVIRPGDLLEALWKAPEAKQEDPAMKQLTALEQSQIEAIENKTRYPGFETLIRVVVSSNTAARSQVILQNILGSFSLFDSPSYNGFKFDYATNVDDLATSYIMRFFPPEVSNNVLNSVELATIFHLPVQKDIPSSKVERQMSKQVDGPTEDMKEGLLIGYNEFRGVKKPIRLSPNDRRRHTYFIGQTGTGKSGLLENLAYQDMLEGRGFAFIDPHGDSAEKLLGMVPRNRVEDVVYFNPGDLENPIGLNLFEFETDDQRDFLVQEAIQMLYRLYDPGHTGIVGPRFEHWFRNAALTIMADPSGSTFIDIPQVFNDQAFADYKLQFVKDQTVLDFWNKEMAQTTESSKSDVLGWFASKFGAFLSNEMMRNVIGQTKSGFNIREIMDKNKILLVNLSKGTTGELNSMLLGMIFIMKFQVAAMSRADIPEDERQDFCLYVDEFQNFATDSFESILSEARKYRLNLILANQFMTQLTDKIREAIIGNVGTIISGRIGITDAEILYKRFSPTFEAEDMTRLPNYQTITSVMINNVPSAPFSMNLIAPVGKSDPRLRDAIKQFSDSKYGKSREAVSKDIFDRLSKGEEFKKQQASGNLTQLPGGGRPMGGSPRAVKPSQAAAKNSSFLDEWLSKRQAAKTTSASQPSQLNQPSVAPPSQGAVNAGAQVSQPSSAPAAQPWAAPVTVQKPAPSAQPPSVTTNPTVVTSSATAATAAPQSDQKNTTKLNNYDSALALEQARARRVTTDVIDLRSSQAAKDSDREVVVKLR